MNNYQRLGLNSGAKIPEIKKKFRELSKKYHPDMPGGNASKFIEIKNAYDALLKGDSGEQSQQDFWKYAQQANAAQQAYKYQQQQQQQDYFYFRREWGEYRFRGIGKDSDGYRIRFYVKNLVRICVFGKNGARIGYFDMRGDVGNVSLLIPFAEAKRGGYEFECVLEDSSGGRQVLRYKVKPPLKGWRKIINKLKFW